MGVDPLRVPAVSILPSCRFHCHLRDKHESTELLEGHRHPGAATEHMARFDACVPQDLASCYSYKAWGEWEAGGWTLDR